MEVQARCVPPSSDEFDLRSTEIVSLALASIGAKREKKSCSQCVRGASGPADRPNPETSTAFHHVAKPKTFAGRARRHSASPRRFVFVSVVLSFLFLSFVLWLSSCFLSGCW